MASSTAASSPNRSVNLAAPTFRLNWSSTLVSQAEGELRAAATRVEHHERAFADPQGRRHREECEPRFLFAGDDLDLEARPLADGLEERLAVGRAAQPGRPDRHDLLHAVAFGFVGHVRDRRRSPLHRLLAELTRLVEALAQPRHLGAVDDRPPCAVRRPLADVELDRVRPDVDHRKAPAAETEERFQPAGKADVRAPSSPSSRSAADTSAGSSDSTAIVPISRPSAWTSVRSAFAPATL